MILNSFFSSNSRTIKVRRLRRRNIRRRFLIFGLPALFISVLAGTYFLNANAASSIQYSFQLDLSELDANFINEAETIFSRHQYRYSYNRPAPYTITVYFVDASQGIQYNSSSSKVNTMEVSATTDINQAITRNIYLTPGEYRVYYEVRVPGGVYPSSNANGIQYYSSFGSYYDNYYGNMNFEQKELTLDGKYPANKQNYSYPSKTIIANEDGTITDGNGTGLSVKIEPRDYNEKPITMDAVLVNNSSGSIPENETLKARIYYTPHLSVIDPVVIATASQPITRTGTQTITFANTDNIPRQLPIELETDYYWSSDNRAEYCVEYEVTDSNGKKDVNWSSFSCDDTYSTYNQYQSFNSNDDLNLLRYVNLRRELRLIDGKMGIMSSGVSNSGWSQGGNRMFVPFMLVSEYNHFDIASNFDHREISESSTATTTLRPVQSVNDIKDGSHYMIVAKNYMDGKYYALTVNGKTNSAKVLDLNDENINGYGVSDETITKSDYIYTVRSSNIDGEIANAKFISNIVSENGRRETLKLNSHSYTYDEMFNDKGGVNAYIRAKYADDNSIMRFQIFKENGTNELALNDLFGNTFFNTASYGRSYLPMLVSLYGGRSENNGNVFKVIDTNGHNQIGGYLNTCKTISVQALITNNSNNCTYATDNFEYYNSEEYYNQWSDTVSGGVYLLTDAPLEDAQPKEQLITTTYEIIDDPQHILNSNNSFILVVADTLNDEKPIGISATNSVEGESFKYYTGYQLTKNGDNLLSTYVKNSFGYAFYIDEDEQLGIKEQDESHIKLYGVRQNDEHNKTPFIMVDGNDNGNFISYSKSRKEMSFYYNNDGTVYLRGGKSDRWIGWGEFVDVNGETHEGFISVNSKDNAVKFAIGIKSPALNGNRNISVNIYDNDGNISKSYVQENYRNEYCYNYEEESIPYCNGYDYSYIYEISPEFYNWRRGVGYPQVYYYSTDYQSGRIPIGQKLGEITEDGLIFAGYTTDSSKAGVVEINEDIENIFNQLSGLDDDFMNKYMIASNNNNYDFVSFATPVSTPVQLKGGYTSNSAMHANLYPVYIKHAITKPALIIDPDNINLIGATDWKDSQTLTPTVNGTRAASDENKDDQVWQGSIKVETYVDGKLYGTPDTLYFQYHNDDAADVILKFVDDNQLTAQTGGDADIKLQQYLLNESILPAKSQNGDYVIDAVIAEQAGSEDGLKYAYNWVNESGARLDNVKGGSTIKVYMSNRYQVKYYLDDEELADNEHQDSNYYASDATAKAIEAESAVLDLNTGISDEQLRGLMDKDITEVDNSEVYKPANPKRFIFEAYKYVVHERDNTFTAATVPTIPEGKRLKGAKWQIKDQDNNIIAEISPEELAAISEQEGGLEEYFNALTQYTYKSDQDNVNTFHLYLYTEEDTPEEPGQPDNPDQPDQPDNPDEPSSPEEQEASSNENKEKLSPKQSDNPFTYEADPAPYFIAAGISVVVIVSFIAVYIYEKNKRKKNKK